MKKSKKDESANMLGLDDVAGLTREQVQEFTEAVTERVATELNLTASGYSTITLHAAVIVMFRRFVKRANMQARLRMSGVKVLYEIAHVDDDTPEMFMAMSWRGKVARLPLASLFLSFLFRSPVRLENGLHPPVQQVLQGLTEYVGLRSFGGVMAAAHGRDALFTAATRILRHVVPELEMTAGALVDDPRYCGRLDWRIAREGIMLQTVMDQEKGVSADRIVLRLQDGLKRLQADFPDEDVTLASEDVMLRTIQARAASLVDA